MEKFYEIVLFDDACRVVDTWIRDDFRSACDVFQLLIDEYPDYVVRLERTDS